MPKRRKTTGRAVGTVARGIRCPIIREGDSIVDITVDAIINAAFHDNFYLRDRDVVAVTEAVVGRAQGNYATSEQIAKDVRNKMGGGTIGVVFPILSRNRFSILLRSFAKASKKIVVQLSYPADEVGNHLISEDALEESGVNPYTDVLSEKQFREYFGYPIHPFTGMDYITYYRQLIEEEGCEAEIIFANDPRAILRYTDCVLCCDIHTLERSKRWIKKAGGNIVLGMDDILNESVDGSGYNPEYGLYGSNKAEEDRVKLFPKDCQEVVDEIARKLYEKTGAKVEAMVYGDGAFKDPVGGIWELADPVVCPAHTPGLVGTPNEIKLKYLADNDFKNLEGDELKEAITEEIKKKDSNLFGKMASEGTTPRRITDLLGSLSDLVSGSGDKGTPVVLVQGYFDNYSMEDN